MTDHDDFYVGWQSRAPRGIGAHVHTVVVSLLFVVLAAAATLALAQRKTGVAVFEWGTLKTFSGTLKTQPYPHLLVPRPGHGGSQSAYYLVAPFKFGLKPEAIAPLDGKPVTLQGTLIYRGDQTMIEARPESIQLAPNSASPPLHPSILPPFHHSNISRVTFTGEIVDSKCYLGVMNPGRLTPHRACAVRCISGGIPPIFLVRQPSGPPLCYFLVSSDGRPVNKQVLDMIAVPVEITGEVVHQGDLAVLRADPASYRPAATSGP